MENLRDRFCHSDESREENLFLKRKTSVIQSHPDADDTDEEGKLSIIDFILYKLLNSSIQRLG